MAKEDNSTDWGCVLPALFILAAGVWWWNSDDSVQPPPPVITPIAAGAPSVPPASAPASSPTAPPPHNYAFVEGDVYGYITAVSEEERKRGKAAGDVLMYRYAGFRDGEFHLERLDDAGNIIGVSTCARPCVAIKSYYGEAIQRIAFNPSSIIGSAMEDAMNGRLMRKKAVAAKQPQSETIRAVERPSVPVGVRGPTEPQGLDIPAAEQPLSQEQGGE